MTRVRIADVAAALSVVPPLTLWDNSDGVKLEIKRHLEPFERQLADLELAALAGPGAGAISENGYSILKRTASEEELRERLTYWAVESAPTSWFPPGRRCSSSAKTDPLPATATGSSTGRGASATEFTDFTSIGAL